jgi:YHS domain-containing protein
VRQRDGFPLWCGYVKFIYLQTTVPGVFTSHGRYPTSYGESDMAIDPVCGMDVNENNAPAKTDYDGKTYYFCSEQCKKDFEEDPEEFISSAA